MVEVALTGPDGAAQIGFAGDVLNTAIYLRRALPAHHEVAYVSMIGCDDLSDRMAEFIAAEGVTTDHLARHPDKVPGLYTISTDDAGERSFAYWREASAARQMFADRAAAEALYGFDVIYLSAITLAILDEHARAAVFAAIDGVRAGGGRLAFDSNFRPRLWPSVTEARRVVEQAWRRCDLALPSVDDEMALFGDTAAAHVQARLAMWGVVKGALKCGAAGPLPLGGNWTVPLRFGAASNVVDTTAAGDSFNGGYLGAALTGASPEMAALTGHAYAGAVLQHHGAIVPQALWVKPVIGAQQD